MKKVEENLNNPQDEVWRDVVGLEKFYKVSNTGLVASKDRDGKDGRKRLKGRILAITTHKKTGQRLVCMSVDGIKYKKEVSRVVVEAFIGEIPKGMQACHLDSEKSHNRLGNLQIMTVKKKVGKTLDHYCGSERMNTTEITQEQLRRYFDYIDGDLVRKKRTALNVKVGESASCIVNPNRKQVKFAGCTMELNRAVYLYHHGILPDYVIPVDGNFYNCAIENLEAQTASEHAKATSRIGNLPGAGLKQEFCKKGHPKTPENTEKDGRCHLCRQEYILTNKEKTKTRHK